MRVRRARSREDEETRHLDSPLVLYASQVALFSLLPFLFLGVKGALRRSLFYVYLGIVTFMMVSILFVVLERDSAIVKNIGLLVVAVNIFQYLLYRSTHAILPDSRFLNPFGMPPDIFSASLAVMLTGWILILLELVIFFYGFRLLARLTTRPLIAAPLFTLLFFAVVMLDGVLFPLINFWLFPDPGAVILGGLGSKAVLGLSFAPVMLLFLAIANRQFIDFLDVGFSLDAMLGLSKEDLADALSEERLHSEQQLRAMNEELEQRVDSRTRDLAVSNDALQEANARLEVASRVKSDYLASMSHEMRTPLNAIIGFSGILGAGLSGELTSEQGRQVKVIESSGKDLLALVSDLLDLSKIEAGAMTLEYRPGDIDELCREAVESLRIEAERRGISLLYEPCEDERLREGLMMDSGKIHQIMLNLLSNAIKFTDEGEVRTIVDCGEDDTLRIRVRDTGIGIDTDSLEKIFVEFEQLDVSASGRPKGTGLGLAISRRLARLMDGDITVVSTVGAGSEFTLAMPIRRDVTPAEALEDL